jgi:hypothetical protein
MAVFALVSWLVQLLCGMVLHFACQIRGTDRRMHFPREGGAAMTWHGCAGINPISGCTTPDDKYLPGRGVL